MEFQDDSDRPNILPLRLVLFFQKKSDVYNYNLTVLDIAMDLLINNQILVRLALRLNRNEFFIECDIFDINHVDNS